MSTKEKTEKPKGPTIGSVAMEALRAGKTNEDALAAVQKKFPEAKTSLASINWYRNKLRSDGEKVPTSRELKKAAAGDAKPAPKGKGKGKKDDPLD